MSKPIPHGTHNGYANYGCRCDECRTATSAYQRMKRAERKASADKPEGFKHGTVGTYTNHLCRCGWCKRAWRTYMKFRNLKKKAADIPCEEPHGNVRTYTYRACRCIHCRVAGLETHRNYQTRKRREARAYQRDTKPIETKKYRNLIEEALQAYSSDSGYLVRMLHAAASASDSSPQ